LEMHFPSLRFINASTNLTLNVLVKDFLLLRLAFFFLLCVFWVWVVRFFFLFFFLVLFGCFFLCVSFWVGTIFFLFSFCCLWGGGLGCVLVGFFFFVVGLCGFFWGFWFLWTWVVFWVLCFFFLGFFFFWVGFFCFFFFGCGAFRDSALTGIPYAFNPKHLFLGSPLSDAPPIRPFSS